MKNKISALKIAVSAAFLLLFGAAFFLSSTAKTSAFKTETNKTENPQNCVVCHQTEYDSWHRTTHQKTVRKASAETIQGDFTRENHFESGDFKAEMSSDGVNFYVKINDESYKIEAVVGVKHIEQYVAEKDGELHSLPVGYNLPEKRWIYLNDTDFAAKNADVSRHLQKWKTDCAVCHQPSENVASENFGNFGISCRSCHGSADEHVESKTSLWAQLGFQTENKIFSPRDLSSDDAMTACATCHSRELSEARNFTAISSNENVFELVSAHQPKKSDSERFWADGSHKFSGNEFPALVRSVCYAQSKSGGHGIAGEKINCSNCHSSHAANGDLLISEKSQNQNCISCHVQFDNDAAIAEHTKHSINSEASNCASCHQPEIVYGRTRFVRTHEISVPNPALTAERQIPNACNLCHIDQSVNWAIASSKKFWSERYMNSKTVSGEEFNQPEAVRLLSSKEPFLRALAADSIKKHSGANQSTESLVKIFQIEPFPFSENFFENAIKNQDKNR